MRSIMLMPLVLLVFVGVLGADGTVEDDGGFSLVGSKHDFVPLGVSEDERCLPCHAPGNDIAVRVKPLWDDSADASRGFQLYQRSVGVPGASSMMCLSCHDGSASVDAFGGMGGADNLVETVGARRPIGRDYDLSGDHPIGVSYPEFDRAYRSKSSIEGAGLVPLPDGRVECISCHDPHGQFGVPDLLVTSNERSALCLTCHRK